ncbi:substrate-binding periplasmic protein [Alkalimarinus coralli]|uniref:substrate-binding periplasmic protein n=1 Tax=Alkalimarinus coralli TaxID=2935863 RepID=UPI00202B909C|nr:transporter substrate-binding domain-containing protein [Alkalimarinus coralli]
MFRIVLITLTFIFSSFVHSAEKITLANGEWAPYLSEDLKHYGYMSHIVSEAFAEEGIEVDYVFLPWKRGFEDAKEGKYQGSLIWGYNEDRAKHFLYSDTVADLGTSLFHQKGKTIEWSELSDLKNYRIGGVIGYAYGVEELEKQGVLKIDRIGKDVGNYKKLAAGRLDIVLEDTEVGHETINRLGMADKLTAHPKTLQSRKYSVIISKKTPGAQALIDAFNRGLKKLKDDGRYQQFLEASRRGEYKQ